MGGGIGVGVAVGAEIVSALWVGGESGGWGPRLHRVSSPRLPLPSSTRLFSCHHQNRRVIYPLVSCSASGTPSPPPASNRLYVSGLSFRTTEESLRNAFEQFGKLTEANLVMDKIANRPRGFAFLRYATEEEAGKAIEGMHGKFLHGRVIFVEVAKPRSQIRAETMK